MIFLGERVYFSASRLDFCGAKEFFLGFLTSRVPVRMIRALWRGG